MPDRIITRATKHRATRRWIGLILLFAMLWTQLAVAAYACPSLIPGRVVTDGIHAASAMSGCDSMRAMPGTMDPDNPNLCLQHALQGDQNADHGQPPLSAPAHVLPLIVAGSPTPPLATLRSALERQLKHATAPPIAIAHCCFRI